MKPSADVIWLIEHTHTNKEDKLEWADGTRSKIIHVCLLVSKKVIYIYLLSALNIIDCHFLIMNISIVNFFLCCRKN